MRTTVAVLVALALTAGAALAADHRDGPVFTNTFGNGALDINDLYVFRAPNVPANTVLAMTVSAFTGVVTPPVFRAGSFYEIKVDNDGDAKEELTFRATFGAPLADGRNAVTLIGLPRAAFPSGNVLAEGFTGQNLPVAGGGFFRAAVFDDPFFFDAVAFDALLNGGPFPRPLGIATNFFGPNVNTLGIVLELPSAALTPLGNATIGVWGRTTIKSKQVDRMGRPAINTALIPPVPRGSNFPGAGPELRTAFNLAKPARDGRFREALIGVLRGAPYGRTEADAGSLADFLLPDVLIFEIGNAAGFPNGRRLRDDVMDTELSLLTSGTPNPITTDNVGDDNGSRITDGTNGTTAAFPYLGAKNSCPGGIPGIP
jgi:hypothetical protein